MSLGGMAAARGCAVPHLVASFTVNMGYKTVLAVFWVLGCSLSARATSLKPILEVTPSSSPWILNKGDDKALLITVRWLDVPDHITMPAPLMSSSVGQLDPLTKVAKHHYTTQLRLDSMPTHPMLIGVLATAHLEEGVVFAGANIEVQATAQVFASAPPGTRATITVGPRTYGPIMIDASGGVDIHIQVSPLDTGYTLNLTEPNSTTTQTWVDLVVPSGRDFHISPTPALEWVGNRGRVAWVVHALKIGQDPTCVGPNGPLQASEESSYPFFVYEVDVDALYGETISVTCQSGEFQSRHLQRAPTPARLVLLTPNNFRAGGGPLTLYVKATDRHGSATVLPQDIEAFAVLRGKPWISTVRLKPRPTDTTHAFSVSLPHHFQGQSVAEIIVTSRQPALRATRQVRLLPAKAARVSVAPSSAASVIGNGRNVVSIRTSAEDAYANSILGGFKATARLGELSPSVNGFSYTAPRILQSQQDIISVQVDDLEQEVALELRAPWGWTVATSHGYLRTPSQAQGFFSRLNAKVGRAPWKLETTLGVGIGQRQAPATSDQQLRQRWWLATWDLRAMVEWQPLRQLTASVSAGPGIAVTHVTSAMWSANGEPDTFQKDLLVAPQASASIGLGVPMGSLQPFWEITAMYVFATPVMDSLVAMMGAIGLQYDLGI